MNKKFAFGAYALVVLVAVVLIALTDSVWPYALLALAVVAVAVHAIKGSSGPGTMSSEQDKAEGRARAGFPMPPERSL